MLDYPSKDGRWTWEELELLAKSLGYHHKIFYENVPPEKKAWPYLKVDGLKLLLDSDILYPRLHKTFNHQNGTYNIKVILKAIELLSERYISFSCLRIARVSFQTYEHTDHAGLEDHFVLRAMQLCGKTMAPLKVKQILRHMGRLVADRLMLYEFIELIASADDISIVKGELPEKKNANGGLDERKLYELCSFEDELSTQEQRYYRYLDQKYEDSRRIIAVEECGSDTKASSKTSNIQQWVNPPLANQAIRKQMSLENKIQSKLLRKHLETSNTDVKQKGYSMPCTCKADIVSSLIKAKEPSKSPVINIDEGKCPLHSVTITKRLSSIVSEQDLDDTARKIESIKWDIATHTQTLKKRLSSRK